VYVLTGFAGGGALVVAASFDPHPAARNIASKSMAVVSALRRPSG
jgi:hypothetical protein